MAHRAGSMYSGHSDYWPNSEIELSYVTPTVSTSSDKKPYSDTRKLLNDTDTAYSSAYNPSQPSFHRRFGDTPAPKRSGRSWTWRKPWKYSKLGASGESDSTKPAHHRGWRKAVILSAVTAGVVLAINLTFTVYTSVKFEVEDGGVGTVYSGECDIVKRWNTAIHLAINVLGTALLSASSYTMQVLNSPTRSEVDRAHAKRITLDIGLPSVKNFRHMKWWRFVLWCGLCFSTLPLHLFWNSTILTTSGSNLFGYILADESFLTGSKYQAPNSTTTKAYTPYGYCTEYSSSSNIDLGNFVSSVYSGYKAGRYTSLTAQECYNDYVNGDGGNRRHVIIITKPSTSLNMSSCGYRNQRYNGSSVIGVDYNLMIGIDWIMNTNNLSPSRYGMPNYTTYGSTATEDNAAQLIRNGGSVGNWYLGPYQVSSCYSETQLVSRCHLQFVPSLLYVVVACNFVKVVCMILTAWTLWNLEEPILATIGDATASFLEQPDGTTVGLCLMDSRKVKKRGWWNMPIPSRYNPVYKRKPVRRLMSATSKKRWWFSMSACTAYLIVGFVLFDLSFELATGDYTDKATALKAKFGAANEDLLLGLEGKTSNGLLIDIIVANSFQLALSTTYFLYNSLYTAQCAAKEWAAYGQGKLKPLRVTWPRGQQRSTYYLHLPWRYGIPLTILLILMHFLISQAIFLARMQYYDINNQIVSSKGYMDAGYSPPAILTACCVGAAMIIAQIINACRPLDNKIPIHGNKSAVISAMCHAGTSNMGRKKSHPHQDGNTASKPVMWGVIDEPGSFPPPRPMPPPMPNMQPMMPPHQQWGWGGGGGWGWGSNNNGFGFPQWGMPFQQQPPPPQMMMPYPPAPPAPQFPPQGPPVPAGHCGFSDTAIEPPIAGQAYF